MSSLVAIFLCFMIVKKKSTGKTLSLEKDLVKYKLVQRHSLRLF